MKTQSNAIPEALNQHLSTNSGPDAPSLAAYVDRGTALVTPEAIGALLQLRDQLQAKVDAIGDSELLRLQIEMLITYIEETGAGGTADPTAQREIAFALLYFLKGFDRIPDSVPEVGLLDDAMVVQIVMQRHAAALRAHWLRQGRAWPASLDS